MQRTAGFADVNGTRLWFDDGGAGSPLVLIHGTPLDARMWDDQVEPFATRHRVIRYDVRGYGRSDPPGATPYRHEDDFRALLDFLQIEQVALVGLSAGARWAVDIALAHPAAVSALILADPSVSGFPWPDDVKAQSAELARTFREGGHEAARKLTLQGDVFATARALPDVNRRLQDFIATYPGWHWEHDDPVIAPSPTAYERLEAITVPTLVIVGERDIADFKDVAGVLAKRIPGAKLRTLPGVGHLSNMQSPAAFNQTVLDFLAGLPGLREPDGPDASESV